jgi:hypothetical protein
LKRTREPGVAVAQTLTEITEDFAHIVRTDGRTEFDIVDVANQIGTPVRRIYDIINVLKGIGLAEKAGRSRFRLKRAPVSANALCQTLELRQHLQDEMESLLESDMGRFAYVDADDVAALATPARKALIIRGPVSMQSELSLEGKVRTLRFTTGKDAGEIVVSKIELASEPEAKSE